MRNQFASLISCKIALFHFCIILFYVGFSNFVQSLSRKFRSANENVNENENFCLFSQKSIEIFTKFAIYVRKFRPFLQNLILFAKIHSCWCEMEKFRFLTDQNWTKISLKKGREYIEIRENVERKWTNFVRSIWRIWFNENFYGTSICAILPNKFSFKDWFKV